MLTLQGTLRQCTEVTFGDPGRTFFKVWLEHSTRREKGPDDLRIEELLIPIEAAPEPLRKQLAPGSPVAVFVRAWAKGRDVVFAAVGLASVGARNPATESPKG